MDAKTKVLQMIKKANESLSKHLQRALDVIDQGFNSWIWESDTNEMLDNCLMRRK